MAPFERYGPILLVGSLLHVTSTDTRIWVLFFASALMVGLVDSTTTTRRMETPFLPLSRSINCHDSYGRLQSDYPQSGTCLTVASITVFMLRRLCESQAMF